MHFSYLLLLLGSVNAVVIQDNVVFNKLNETTVSRSRWLMTLVINLDTYQRFIDKLQYDTNEVSALIEIASERYEKLKFQPYYVLFRSLKREIVTVRQSCYDIKRSHHEYASIRNKRSVLPFVGDIMSFLFGPISEKKISNKYKRMFKIWQETRRISFMYYKTA